MKKTALDIIEHAEEHLIEKIAENMHTFGMPSTVGRVLGIIYMNRKPMTLSELSEATGMSKNTDEPGCPGNDRCQYRRKGV